MRKRKSDRYAFLEIRCSEIPMEYACPIVPSRRVASRQSSIFSLRGRHVVVVSPRIELRGTGDARKVKNLEVSRTKLVRSQILGVAFEISIRSRVDLRPLCERTGPGARADEP